MAQIAHMAQIAYMAQIATRAVTLPPPPVRLALKPKRCKRIELNSKLKSTVTYPPNRCRPYEPLVLLGAIIMARKW